MAIVRGAFGFDNSYTSQSQLGQFSLPGAFDYYDPFSGVLPICEFDETVNASLKQLNSIVQDARKILQNRNTEEIIQQAERIQLHLNDNFSHFIRYMRFTQLLDNDSPSKMLLFCIDDLTGPSDSDQKKAWNKSECFSILALSLAANMYANFWKSINEFGINSSAKANIRHYEWFTQFSSLAQEAMDHASTELITDHQEDEREKSERIVRPDHIVAHYIDYMLSEHVKHKKQNKRFVYKTVTVQFIENELNDEEIFMMGLDKCLNCLLKHWRDYRKSHDNWQNS